MRLFFPEDRLIKDVDELKDIIDFEHNSLLAFDEEKVLFFDRLSKYLLKQKSFRQFPELLAFAFWIRKSNIKKFLSTLSQNNNIIYVPRGLVFHVAPSNVDYMFLYSWFISILAGNSNVLRISSHYDKNIVSAIKTLIKFAKENNYKWFLNNNVVINYEHNDKINTLLASKADVRVFWGGDETIRRMRKFDTKTNVKDIYFADKFSYSIINSKYYIEANEEDKNSLASAFYNDSYLFNQKACSSPQIVFFSGNSKSNITARKIFWNKLTNEIEKREIKKTTSLIMEHYLNWFLLAANNKVSKVYINSIRPTIVRMSLKNISNTYRTCGGGFFIECFIKSLNQLDSFGSEADQTLAYYGFKKSTLKNYIIKKGYRSNLRIVPIGQSLQFDIFWDGYNLLNELVKTIAIY